MRCPECHGRVRAHSAGRDGISAHFEHRENNPGCYLGYNFDGVERKRRKPEEEPLNARGPQPAREGNCRNRHGARPAPGSDGNAATDLVQMIEAWEARSVPVVLAREQPSQLNEPRCALRHPYRGSGKGIGSGQTTAKVAHFPSDSS